MLPNKALQLTWRRLAGLRGRAAVDWEVPASGRGIIIHGARQLSADPLGSGGIGLAEPDFDREQYRELKKEVRGIVADIRSTERNVVLAAWAIWGFAIAQSAAGSILSRLSWLAPPLVCLGAVRTLALYVSVRPRSEYLRQLERVTQRGAGLEGWDNFLARRRNPIYGAVSALFWLAFIGVAVVISLSLAPWPPMGVPSVSLGFGTGAPDLVVGFISGALASGVAAIFLDRRSRPRLKIGVATSERAQGQSGENPPHEFFHVRVVNTPAIWPISRRRPAWACQASLAVMSDDGATIMIGPIYARWTSQPEPVLAIGTGQGIVNIPDGARMISGRKVDVHSHEAQLLPIAVKFEGAPDLHLFTNESYLFPRWSNPAWRLPAARSRLRVAVDYEEGRVQSDFWIYNRGSRRDDIAIEPVEP